jgi:RNA polymerase sigma-70 factor (ECF subfamily)
LRVRIGRTVPAGCLQLLDDGQRRCIVLAYVEGLSHSQITGRVNAPLGSVKSWIRRGLLSLRRCLQQ